VKTVEVVTFTELLIPGCDVLTSKTMPLPKRFMEPPYLALDVLAALVGERSVPVV
jgi:hypothetical protein